VKPERRTQAERRATTRAAVLQSACRLFGRKGYTDTSLEEIAAEAGMTIRPIYHYFGSKVELFSAVNDLMEDRILEALQNSEEDTRQVWRRFIGLCEDPEFRQVILVDAPNVLGRERHLNSGVSQTVAARFGGPAARVDGKGPGGQPDLVARMLIGALSAAALAIAEADDPTRAAREAESLILGVATALVRPPKSASSDS